ncbi:hypothetical protein GCM10010428_42310 [Actinosynnema pretiosum subsp. pretiosum]
MRALRVRDARLGGRTRIDGRNRVTDRLESRSGKDELSRPEDARCGERWPQHGGRRTPGGAVGLRYAAAGRDSRQRARGSRVLAGVRAARGCGRLCLGERGPSGRPGRFVGGLELGMIFGTFA